MVLMIFKPKTRHFRLDLGEAPPTHHMTHHHVTHRNLATHVNNNSLSADSADIRVYDRVKIERTNKKP